MTTPLVVFSDDPGLPAPELLLLEDCEDCHMPPGQRCTTWWGTLRSGWHGSRVDAARAKLPAP